jgi:hypothetical protein
VATTFQELQAIILAETNRGRNAQVIAAIPGRINMVVSWIEKNFNCQHMKKYEVFNLDPGGLWPRAIVVPAPLKSIRFIRRLNCCTTGSPCPDPVGLTRVDPESVPPDRGEDILSYWISGRDMIWFDNTPQVTTRFDWVVQYYTGTIVDLNATHYLFDVAQDFMVAKTMMLMAPFMRDQQVFQLYQSMADEGMKTFLTAEGAIEDEGGRDDMMEYGQIYQDYAYGGATR